VLSIRRVNPTTSSFATRFLFGPDATARVDAGSWVLVAACVALLTWKARAIWTLNVNWDEFYFLTHVHALLRGDLQIPFQTTYTQAFRWLPWVGDEMAQIHAARLCMFVLLALSVWQIARLASRWTSPGAALAGALAFLCLLPIQVHGASFRADSMLLPILLGVLLLVTRPHASRRVDLWIGVLCGLGMAVSVKLALFAPLFLACLLLAGGSHVPWATQWRAIWPRALVIGAVTLGVAAILVGLHHLTLKAPDLVSASSFADRSLGKAILETRFLPGEFYLRFLLMKDRFVWIVMGIGFVLAVVRRRWLLASMVLAVSPLLFYRNAFPYFYVEMLAPVALYAALVVDELRALARRGASGTSREWVPAACGLLLLVHGSSRLPLMSTDEQLGQRRVLDAVHRIFPQPVTYFDHAGMVASFHKVNFFMSTWGMDEYLRRGAPFVAPALRAYRPALMLVNRDYLDVTSPHSQALIPEDREALQRFYLPYWGPIHVAGASVALAPGAAQTVALPFPGKYRVESAEPVLIDGVLRGPGDVIDVVGGNALLARQATASADSLEVRLLTAQAGMPPAETAEISYIFTGL
jgi:hypothetical protein